MRWRLVRWFLIRALAPAPKEASPPAPLQRKPHPRPLSKGEGGESSLHMELAATLEYETGLEPHPRPLSKGRGG